MTHIAALPAQPAISTTPRYTLRHPASDLAQAAHTLASKIRAALAFSRPFASPSQNALASMSTAGSTPR